jgi:hypothetical protein
MLVLEDSKMKWFDLSLPRFQQIKYELADMNAKFVQLDAQIKALQDAHLSLRGRFYKQKALDEDQKKEEEPKQINTHDGRYL